MTKKTDPYRIKAARNDAEEGEPIPLELSGNPAEVFRALAVAAGEPVNHAWIDAWADYCDAPVEHVHIDVEFEMGECKPDPHEVTSRWPDDLTRH